MMDVEEGTKCLDNNVKNMLKGETKADKNPSSKGPEKSDVFLIPEESNVGNREEKDKEEDQFAIPSLPVYKFVKPHSKSIANDSNKTDLDKTDSVGKQTKSIKENICVEKNDSKESKDINNTGLQYTEPAWTGPPDNENKYALTVLKDGVVKDNIDLSGKSLLTFGRLDDCDVLVEHPSCSRFHALLQYCVIEKDKRKKGYYLFDLGSTHGTYLNKEKLRPKVYTRIRVGYQIKFGGSTRLYIVEGPEEDQEEEVDLDALREKRRQYEQLQMEQKHKLKQKNKPNKGTTSGNKEIEKDGEDNNDEEEDEGATWGFGEDAQDEGLDLKELFEKKKNIEVKDPKKSLRGFFEREGIEFEYEMSERGSGTRTTHLAQVRIPIETSEGSEVVAEGSGTTKKDAVLACATEACRLIQAYDMLQNQCREDQRLKRQRELEANDFYDSDEDSYLDRTGSIEKKRLQRKVRAGQKEENQKVDTHDSLKEKLKTAEEEMESLEKKLQLAKAAEDAAGDGDSLDAYMSTMKHSMDNSTKLKIRRKLVELKKEITKLKNLVEKTKPALLPALINNTMPKVQVAPPLRTDETSLKQGKHSLTTKIENPINGNLTVSKPDNPVKKDGEKSGKQDENKEIKNSATEDNHLEPPSKKKKKKKKRVYGAPMKQDTSDEMRMGEEKDFVEWMPPENQTGDGRTALNDKLGY